MRYTLSLRRISIHALREEGDEVSSLCKRHGERDDFYPRPPRGGRQTSSELSISDMEFLSTPSARRATYLLNQIDDCPLISIHALREEGDCCQSFVNNNTPYFYPRPPRGGRQLTGLCPFHEDRFLSTPSARRATGHARSAGCGGRFLSTPSARRATVQADSLRHPGAISIHALREEGDGVCRPRMPSRLNFYPRPPRGGRQSKTSSVSGPWIFLSTPSARRATDSTSYEKHGRQISIHALREEGDLLL